MRGFGDELHVAIFDAVVDHLDVVTGTTGTNVRDARSVVGLGGNGFEHRLELLVGIDRAAGHEGRSPEGAFFTTGNTHANELQATGGVFGRAALGVGVEGVAAINQDVAFIEIRGDFLSDGIDRSTGLDHQQDAARSLQGVHQLLDAEGAENVGVLRAGGEELLGAGGGAIVDGGGESVAGDVEGKVLAHHRQPDHTNVPLA